MKGLGAGDKVDHPMADIAQAREIIAALPAGDSIKALGEAVRWLTSISETAGFKLAQRYELIDMIDVPLKRHGQQLLEQYLALKPQSKSREGALWKAAMDFLKAQGDAYLMCVAQTEIDKNAAATFRKTLPSLVARAIRAQMLQIKWILMRYGYVHEDYWRTVARLHNLAESGGFLDEIADIYGGAHGRGTVRQELVRVLMLGVCSTGGLSPIRQNIAERTIAHFSGAFVSGMQAGEGCTFLFDLNGGTPPSRVLARTPASARLFYFGAGDAVNGAQKIVDAIHQTGALLSDINLGPSESIDQVADTLLHLALNWDKKFPMRDSERRSISATFQVTHGLDGMLSQEGGVTESWTVIDVSLEGYGAVVPGGCGEWLYVGALIGIRPEGSDASWGAGLVRRIVADANGQRRVGIQVISRGVVPATMCTLPASGVRGAPQEALLLDAEPSSSGYLLAVLRPNTFTLRDVLEAKRMADGKAFQLTPSGIVESGPDCDRVRFKTA